MGEGHTDHHSDPFKQLCLFIKDQGYFSVTYYLSMTRGQYHKCYSVITITLCYIFALLHCALYLWRIVIAFDSNRFRLFAGVYHL
jgi:hypothetical protein